MEDITDADYAPSKRISKDLEIKNLRAHHNLYVQSITLLFVDLFENFQSVCLEIYELDPAYFLTVSDLVWQAALKGPN